MPVAPRTAAPPASRPRRGRRAAPGEVEERAEPGGPAVRGDGGAARCERAEVHERLDAAVASAAVAAAAASATGSPGRQGRVSSSPPAPPARRTTAWPAARKRVATATRCPCRRRRPRRRRPPPGPRRVGGRGVRDCAARAGRCADRPAHDEREGILLRCAGAAAPPAARRPGPAARARRRPRAGCGWPSSAPGRATRPPASVSDSMIVPGDLDPLDRVDAQVGLEVGVEVEHVGRVARALADDVEQAGRQLLPRDRSRGRGGRSAARRRWRRPAVAGAAPFAAAAPFAGGGLSAGTPPAAPARPGPRAAPGQGRHRAGARRAGGALPLRSRRRGRRSGRRASRCAPSRGSAASSSW